MMTVEKKVVTRTIHHIKTIKIIPFFLWSPLTFCLFVLYSISIHKQQDNSPYGSRQITYSCTQLKNSITNVKAISFNPVNATLLSLLHAWTDWIQYQYEQGDWKTSRFTAVVRPISLWRPNWQTPGIFVTTSY